MTRFLLTVLAACFVVTGCQHKQIQMHNDASQLRKEIEANLPIGSSRADVIAFLDKKEITHSHVGALPESPDASNTEMAMIRGESTSGSARRDVQIIFKFDTSDSKLQSYTVKEIFTGP